MLLVPPNTQGLLDTPLLVELDKPRVEDKSEACIALRLLALAFGTGVIVVVVMIGSGLMVKHF